MCSFPPTDFVDIEPYADDNFTKWYTKTRTGWVVKNHEVPCYGCGSPWCLYHENRQELREKIDAMARCRHSTMKQKRYRCYRDAISMKWGTLGHTNMKRVGWCWENKVKVAFADDMNTYTGFKVSNQNESRDEEEIHRE